MQERLLRPISTLCHLIFPTRFPEIRSTGGEVTMQRGLWQRKYKPLRSSVQLENLETGILDYYTWWVKKSMGWGWRRPMIWVSNFQRPSSLVNQPNLNWRYLRRLVAHFFQD